jgi:diguanylate cyclase (GGDEF)-like protein
MLLGRPARYHRITRDSLTEMRRKTMHDQSTIWITDTDLAVTSFTARLRDLAGIGDVYRRVHVSDLWGHDEPYGPVIVAHRWALDGQAVSFEAPAYDSIFRFYLEPLQAPDGRIVGVSGRAVDLRETQPPDVPPGTLADAERQAGLGTWNVDLRTGQMRISLGLAAMLGIDPHDDALDIRAFDHPGDREAIARIVDDPESKEGYTCDHRIVCPGGRVRAVRERVRTVFDERGMATLRVGTLIDITDLKEREAELADLALYDALTRLPNRALLGERLSGAVARAERHSSHCAVLFLDLDDFKRINDTHGHADGDRLLIRLADHLQRQVRATDTVARLAGDEFVLLLEDLYSEEAAVSAAHKLLRSFDEPIFIDDDRALSISASIGIAIAPRCSTDPKELLALADHEMYVVKRNGGAGVKLAAGKESAAHFSQKGTCTPLSSKDPAPFAIRQSA